jgi:hypothetical protein
VTSAFCYKGLTGEHRGRRSISIGGQRSFTVALAISLVAHGTVLLWRVPHPEPNRLGAETKTPPRLQATIADRSPAPILASEPAEPPRPEPHPSTMLPVIPESGALVVSKPPMRNPSPKTAAPKSTRPEAQQKALASERPEPQPPSAVVAERDAAIGEEELEALRSMVRGQGRIRFSFTVNVAGRVEDLVVETTEIPAELERTVTRQLFSTPFLPAHRAGATASSMFSLELEP